MTAPRSAGEHSKVSRKLSGSGKTPVTANAVLLRLRQPI
jgi:hypothetical protein